MTCSEPIAPIPTKTHGNKMDQVGKAEGNRIYEAKGSANLRRDALMCSYTSLLEKTFEDPVRIWLVILSTVVVYLYYLHVIAEDFDAVRIVSFSDVWLSKPIVASFLYVGMIKFAGCIVQPEGKTVAGAFEIIAVYNICQTIFNAVMFWRFFSEVYSSEEPMSWWGNTMETTKNHRVMAFLIWVHYNNKYIELFDTFFIIMRKRWSQMSALHVLMRILLLWSWYFVCRYGCGGDAYFGAMMHSFTQVFTYSYYFVALFHFTDSVGFKRNLWRGVVLRLHIAQFYVGSVHAIYILFCVDYNPWLAAWQLTVMLIFIVLFSDFHYHKNDSPPIEQPKEPRIVFSFDSSGWLYVYHFGAAKYIEAYLRKDLKKPVAYSGASGGGIVAAALSAKIDITKMSEWVFSASKHCTRWPSETTRALKMAVAEFMPEELPPQTKTNLKILATRVSLRRIPFFMGEILQDFSTREGLRQAIMASTNVPLIFGICPKRVQNPDRCGYYYDGMFWSQTFGFVPWRGFTENDEIFRLATISRISSDFMILPPMWAIFPPPIPVMRGIFALGYVEAHRRFSNHEAFIEPEPISEEMLASVEVFRAALKAYWRRVGQISLTLVVCTSAILYPW